MINSGFISSIFIAISIQNIKSFVILILQSLQHKIQQEKMEVDNLSNRTEDMIEKGPQCLYTSDAMDVVHRFRAASESINVSFILKLV